MQKQRKLRSVRFVCLDLGLLGRCYNDRFSLDFLWERGHPNYIFLCEALRISVMDLVDGRSL